MQWLDPIFQGLGLPHVDDRVLASCMMYTPGWEGRLWAFLSVRQRLYLHLWRTSQENG